MAATSTKTVPYTEAQVATLAEMKAANASIEAIAAAVGKSTRSVIAKLAQLGLYQAKSREKATSATKTKAELIHDISKALNIPFEDIQTLEAAQKGALQTLVAALSADH